jgi:hypothetical protein
MWGEDLTAASSEEKLKKGASKCAMSSCKKWPPRTCICGHHMIISAHLLLVLGPRTVSRLSGSGWKKPFTLNLDEGTSDQAFLPSTSILHSSSGLLASPANLQLRPMMAMGSLAGSVPMPSMVCMVPLGNAAMKCKVKFSAPRRRRSLEQGKRL